MNSNRNGRTHYASFAVIAAGALILGLGLPSCTANKAESSPKTPQEQVSATVAWESDEVLVSDVKVLGEVAIAYRRQGPQMEVIARNLNNGEQLWKDEALGAADAQGIVPEIITAEYNGKTYVAYLGTKTGAYGQLKITNVATGKPYRIKNNFEFWGDRPSVCGDTFCTEGRKSRGENLLERVHLKFEWASRQWQVVPERELEKGIREGGRSLGEGITSYWNENDQEILSYSHGKKLLWERPYEKVFAKGYGSTGGWHWDSVGKNKEILIGFGSLTQDDFIDSEKKKAKDRMVDLNKLVALDAKTGRTLWQLQGIAYGCGDLTGQGFMADEKTAVVCHYDAGTQVLTRKRGRIYAKTTNVTWTASGIDIKTGARKWRLKLSDPYAYDERLEDAGIPLNRKAMTLLPVAGGDQAVTKEEGRTIALQQVLGETTICRFDRDPYYIYSATLGTTAPWDHKASGDTLFQEAQGVCKRGSWKPTNSIPAVQEFGRVGYDEKELVVLSTLQGMVAYRLIDASGN